MLAALGLALFLQSPATAQSQLAPGPDKTLSEALSAACRQDSDAFAKYLTSDNAAAFKTLPGGQRTAMMKRFVLLEDAGRPLITTGANGQSMLRCETPAISTEMRFGAVRVRENLAFVPMEIPFPGEPSRTITFGLVREGGNWKLISVGLALLDIPSMANQWEQADLDENEANAIAELRILATALETYRNAYGKLPETLATLGPAPPNGISPEAAGLIDAQLASGDKDGYTVRYNINPAGDLPREDADKAETFSLASTPDTYGKTGRRSFFLDSTGTLRAADKQGAVAVSTDPPVGPA
jgi:hypothetical protein